MSTRRWRDLSTGQRVAFLAMSAVQVGLAAVAWVDLARRPAEQVNGRKPLWAGAIAVNFVGPIAYLVWGRPRRHHPEP
jgi:hypothetical protein